MASFDPITDWSDWIDFILADPNNRQILDKIGVIDAVTVCQELSCCKVNNSLLTLTSWWSTLSHTLTTWGEFSQVLEDVTTIMHLLLAGANEYPSLKVTDEDMKTLYYLHKHQTSVVNFTRFNKGGGRKANFILWLRYFFKDCNPSKSLSARCTHQVFNGPHGPHQLLVYLVCWLAKVACQLSYNLRVPGPYHCSHTFKMIFPNFNEGLNYETRWIIKETRDSPMLALPAACRVDALTLGEGDPFSSGRGRASKIISGAKSAKDRTQVPTSDLPLPQAETSPVRVERAMKQGSQHCFWSQHNNANYNPITSTASEQTEGPSIVHAGETSPNHPAPKERQTPNSSGNPAPPTRHTKRKARRDLIERRERRQKIAAAIVVDENGDQQRDETTQTVVDPLIPSTSLVEAVAGDSTVSGDFPQEGTHQDNILG
ncbi:hypothetical protein F0562_010454 [Nyssa sinensis]|uniref:Aminotransferase-like plant mobile domain-containing protein n=1 Tax=Nyssa sinensis TaxID=561372 RepID=A0A5J5A236_9ASTE|nr:hypothetical protein F0562_010454 [Nyssa sinensis]